VAERLSGCEPDCSVGGLMVRPKVNRIARTVVATITRITQTVIATMVRITQTVVFLRVRVALIAASTRGPVESQSLVAE
jgi:hypothetical protein